MSRITTPLEIYKFLPKSNCGRCRPATCLAFSAAIIKQELRLVDCPHLDKEIVARLEPRIARPPDMDAIREQQLEELRKKAKTTDLAGRAGPLGGRRAEGGLIISCLGKDFEIDREGRVKSQCHTHAWFSLPLLDYVLHGRGAEISGEWVPFRELPNGRTWGPLFEQRCERPMKRIADAYSDLFGDLADLFSAASSFNTFGSDVSVVLYPFPKVPVLICFWKAEDDMESKLHVFFDRDAEQNLSIESLFTLGTGLTRMFERIMHTHTGGKSELS